MKYRAIFMDDESFNDFLHSRYYPQLEHAKKRALHHQQAYNKVQWATIIFSFLTSALVGLGQLFSWVPLKVGALIASLVVTSLVTILKTFDFQKKWDNYSQKVMELEKEYDLFCASTGVYSKTEDKKQQFITQVHDIEMKRYSGSISFDELRRYRSHSDSDKLY